MASNIKNRKADLSADEVYVSSLGQLLRILLKIPRAADMFKVDADLINKIDLESLLLDHPKDNVLLGQRLAL
jgi:hypothetical protein